MSIDKNDMTRARSWAKEILEWKGWAPSAHVIAAAKVIENLPDTWIDADEVREVMRWREDSPTGDDYDSEFWTRLEAILPTPLKQLVEVEMGKWVHHPEYGQVLMLSTKLTEGENVLIAREVGGTITGIATDLVSHSSLSPLAEEAKREKERFITYHHWNEGNAGKHWTLPGGPYETGGMIPRTEDEQQTYLYEDRDGFGWSVNGDPEELPAEFAPYTKITTASGLRLRKSEDGEK